MAERPNNIGQALLSALSTGIESYGVNRENAKQEALSRAMLAVKLQADQQKREEEAEEHKLNMTLMQSKLRESDLSLRQQQLEYDNFMPEQKKIEMRQQLAESIANIRAEVAKTVASARGGSKTQLETLKEMYQSGDPALKQFAIMNTPAGNTAARQFGEMFQRTKTAKLAELRKQRDDLDAPYGGKYSEMLKHYNEEGSYEELSESDKDLYDEYVIKRKAVDDEIAELTTLPDGQAYMTDWMEGFQKFVGADSTDGDKLDKMLESALNSISQIEGLLAE